MILGMPTAIAESLWQETLPTLRFAFVSLGCIYIATMMIWSYYMACIVPPGTVDRGLYGVCQEMRHGPGSTLWWRQAQEKVALAAQMGPPEAVSNEATSKSAEMNLESSEPSPMDKAEQKKADLSVTFRFCKKCKYIRLANAIAHLPPELRQREKANRRNRILELRRQASQQENSETLIPDISHPPSLFEDEDDEGEYEISQWLGEKESEMMVLPPKPERAHHCRTCKACVLKFDHHCPWINQCVGLGNERYFILFMCWFALGTLIFTAAGWRLALLALRKPKAWPSTLVPRVVYLALIAKSAIMGMAVFILACWHLHLVMQGETSVENQDNGNYRKMAKERNDTFQNVYDLGSIRNLQIFFNVGPGMAYQYYTLFLPIHIEPYSDGWHWAKRKGFGGHHMGISRDEEFTDDEGDPILPG